MWTIALMLAGQFFDRPDVDFWGTRKSSATTETAPSWAEPGHVPPAPVVRLLDNPTRENALAYLKWQEDRLARLRAALKAIGEVGPSQKSPAPDEKPPGRSSEILYFSQDHCPFCQEQDRQLEGADLHGRTLRRLTPEREPELWKRYRVTASPTLVIDGNVLRGVQTREQIEKATAR